MNKKLVTVILSLLIINPTTAYSKNTKWPWKDNKTIWPWKDNKMICSGDNSSCNAKDVFNTLSTATEYCVNLYQEFDKHTVRGKRYSGIIGFVGTIFGVAGATTTGTASTWFSGLSGTTNAFQASTNDIMVTSVTQASLTSIQEMVYIYNVAIQQQIEKKNYDTAVMTAMNLASQCRFAPSVVSQRMLDAVKQTYPMPEALRPAVDPKLGAQPGINPAEQKEPSKTILKDSQLPPSLGIQNK
ncbi:hypothetical protein MKL42_09450 [Acinetobacter sp. AOR15_HL]|uniref:hypothetical protein n=1 Tax=unclassified Acinetobacter TaxID=196816 RepID=UPI0022EA2615|nr:MULTISPECIES: hypothetical protein [unclassified Acinetobacter]MDA3557717.1 hypothetical protein [Acinetobacter sp. AOR15_HL]MDA3570940.1 hypothetical protein [Acinetobacter sp. AOR14_HL]